MRRRSQAERTHAVRDRLRAAQDGFEAATRLRAASRGTGGTHVAHGGLYGAPGTYCFHSVGVIGVPESAQMRFTAW